jgi:hypothetical protein
LRAEAGHRYAAGGIRVSRGLHERLLPSRHCGFQSSCLLPFRRDRKSIYLGNEIDIDPTDDDGLHA